MTTEKVYPNLVVSSVAIGDDTQIFSAIDAGDPQAAYRLLPLVYNELRMLAAAHIDGLAPTSTRAVGKPLFSQAGKQKRRNFRSQICLSLLRF
jgi:hypothetical protein